MFKKYFIIMDCVTIAMKFNEGSNEVTIGGFLKFKENMEFFMTNVFLLNHLPKPVFIQINKIRYTFKLKIDFLSVVEHLEEIGCILQKTTNLQNVMR